MLARRLATSLILLSLVFLARGARAADPPPDRVTVEVITINGSGCPAGTVDVAIAPNNTALTLIYDALAAEIGPDARPSAFRRNCQLTLPLHVPSGWTYAIASVRARGDLFLASGVSATVKRAFAFQGEVMPVPWSTTIAGPSEDDWELHDAVDATQLRWAPCGEQRLLNVNSELRLARGSSGSGTQSYVDQTQQQLGLVWKRCPAH